MHHAGRTTGPHGPAGQALQAESAGSRVPPLGGTAGPKQDPLVRYINQTNVSFQDQLLEPLRGLAAEIRAIRNHVVLSDELQKNQGPLVEKVRKIDEEAGRAVERAKQIDRRMQRQARAAEKKAVVASSGPRTLKAKSAARRNAGKVKAEALASWHADVRVARQALKNEGYTGSLNLKKGMPMHQKIMEIQNARAARELAAPGLAGRSRPVSPAQSAPLVQGERLALHRDAVVHAPPHLRTAAKRGDDNIAVQG